MRRMFSCGFVLRDLSLIVKYGIPNAIGFGGTALLMCMAVHTKGMNKNLLELAKIKGTFLMGY